MKKATVVCFSLLCAALPLASACVDSAPINPLPEEATLFGPGAGHSSNASPAAAPLSNGHGQGAAPASRYIFPREATLYGKSYEEWAAKWWQWVIPIPLNENPQADAPCDMDQSGQVFFLAANFGGTTTRSCAVPAGKAIFFPILNAVSANCPEIAGGDYTCEVSMDQDRLHDSVNGLMELDHTLSLEIDGVAVDGLSDYRAGTATFNTTAPENAEDRLWTTCSGPIRDNACGVPVGTPRGVASDGYWVMLRPLSAGDHQIHLGAGVQVSGQTIFSLDITYNITVAP